MAELRFVKKGEYELFLDEDIYNSFLNGDRYRCVYVLWHGWHREWQPSMEARERMHRGALYRDQSDGVILDLLRPVYMAALQVVKLQPQPVCSSDFISFVVNVIQDR